MTSNDDVFGEEYYRDQLYTPMQSRILVNIPRISGALSIIGSSIIVYIILKDRKRKLRRLYHRILLSHSCIDIICSFNWALSSLVVPKGTPGVWDARGTLATCDASGFINQFSFSLTLYFTFLCTYYTLILAFRVRERTMTRWLEPIVHFLAFAPPVIFGIAMLATNHYNPNNISVGWCFINVYPMDCLRRDEIECERGENYAVWMAFFYTITSLAFAVIVVSCATTYWAVRRQFQRSARWVAFDTCPRKKDRETAVQAFLYVASFVVTYIGLAISVFGGPSPATKDTQYYYFPVTVLVKIFYPLQGFWNFFIFVRPRYHAIRSHDSLSSCWGIFSQILGNRVSAPTGHFRTSHAHGPSNTTSQLNIFGLSHLFSLKSVDDFMPESHGKSTAIDFPEDSTQRTLFPSTVTKPNDSHVARSQVGATDASSESADVVIYDDETKKSCDCAALTSSENNLDVSLNRAKRDQKESKSPVRAEDCDQGNTQIMASQIDIEKGLPDIKEPPVMPNCTDSAELTIDA